MFAKTTSFAKPSLMTKMSPKMKRCLATDRDHRDDDPSLGNGMARLGDRCRCHSWFKNQHGRPGRPPHLRHLMRATGRMMKTKMTTATGSIAMTCFTADSTGTCAGDSSGAWVISIYTDNIAFDDTAAKRPHLKHPPMKKAGTRACFTVGPASQDVSVSRRSRRWQRRIRVEPQRP